VQKQSQQVETHREENVGRASNDLTFVPATLYTYIAHHQDMPCSTQSFAHLVSLRPCLVHIYPG